jgi:hypothetical protein
MRSYREMIEMEEGLDVWQAIAAFQDPRIDYDARCRAAAEFNRTRTLPTLTGSPRQVEYAELIRAEFISSHFPRLRGRDWADQAEQIDRISWQTSATWWIDAKIQRDPLEELWGILIGMENEIPSWAD